MMGGGDHGSPKQTLESESQKIDLSLSDPQFPHLSSGDSKSNCLRALLEGSVRHVHVHKTLDPAPYKLSS